MSYREFDVEVLPGPPGERTRPVVLMVEDDPADRELYGKILCYNGFDVVLAGAGTDAVERAQQVVPDCVLLDLGLPDMSGLEVCQALRARTATAAVPVVILSGRAQSEMGGRARDAGCVAYIEKPTEPVQVLKEIERLTGRPPLAGVGDPPRLVEPPGN
jgi:two-component system phosphate regulon response regulator PhoB